MEVIEIIKNRLCVRAVVCFRRMAFFDIKFSHLILQAEWEALEIVEHEWALENVEEELMEEYCPSDVTEVVKDKYV